jgi:hypothetical protein
MPSLINTHMKNEYVFFYIPRMYLTALHPPGDFFLVGQGLLRGSCASSEAEDL